MNFRTMTREDLLKLEPTERRATIIARKSWLKKIRKESHATIKKNIRGLENRIWHKRNPTLMTRKVIGIDEISIQTQIQALSNGSIVVSEITRIEEGEC